MKGIAQGCRSSPARTRARLQQLLLHPPPAKGNFSFPRQELAGGAAPGFSPLAHPALCSLRREVSSSSSYCRGKPGSNPSFLA